MTSLALAHGHPAPPFNSDFYIAAATVIPVLFIAIAVGADCTYQGFAKRLAKDFYESSQATDNFLRFARHPKVWVASNLVNLTLLVLASGTLGEILAFVALSTRQAPAWMLTAVMTAVISLTVIAAAGPAGSLARAYLGSAMQAARETNQEAGPQILPARSRQPPTIREMRRRCRDSMPSQTTLPSAHAGQNRRSPRAKNVPYRHER